LLANYAGDRFEAIRGSLCVGAASAASFSGVDRGEAECRPTAPGKLQVLRAGAIRSFYQEAVSLAALSSSLLSRGVGVWIAAWRCLSMPPLRWLMAAVISARIAVATLSGVSPPISRPMG